jgi:hypothetical protein
VALCGDQQVIEAFAAQGVDEVIGDRVSRAVTFHHRPAYTRVPRLG